MNNLNGNPVSEDLKIFKGNLHHHGGWHYEYTYSGNGKVKTQRSFHRNNLTARYEFEYDSMGNKVLEKCLDIINKKDAPEVYITEYSYEENGRIKNQTLIFHDNKIMWIKDSISYTDKNQIASYKKTMPALSARAQESFEKHVLTYTEKGLIRNSSMVNNLDSSRKARYVYNEEGDPSAIEISERMVFNKQEPTNFLEIIYSYKYDKNRNWIKRYARVNGSKKKLELKRKIKYR